MCKIVIFFNNLCIDRDVSTAMLSVFVKRRGRKFVSLLIALWFVVIGVIASISILITYRNMLFPHRSAPLLISC